MPAGPREGGRIKALRRVDGGSASPQAPWAAAGPRVTPRRSRSPPACPGARSLPPPGAPSWGKPGKFPSLPPRGVSTSAPTMGCGASRTRPRSGAREPPQTGTRGEQRPLLCPTAPRSGWKVAVASVSRSWGGGGGNRDSNSGASATHGFPSATGVSLSPKATVEQFRVVGCFEKFTPHTQGKGNTPKMN